MDAERTNQDPAAGTSTRRDSTLEESQALAQRSPPGSVRSQIQLQPTVLHMDVDNENGFDTGRTDSKMHIQRWTDDHERYEGNALANDSDDDNDNDRTPLTKIDVGGPAWDDSDEEGNDFPEEHDVQDIRRQRRNQRLANSGVDHSYLGSLRPSTSRFRHWLIRLTKSPSNQASLSAPHVAANLFSASLNPAVLLSMPAYFNRTGIALGLVGLVTVAALAGAGGGVWVVLSRYVGGSHIEAITGASCGRNTLWKSNAGRAISGLLLACYATGTAVIAYFALADLLLQVLFHYSPHGIPLHDRLFVTIVIGGLITTPLIIFPLAKRNLIRLSTALAVFFYPITLVILLSYIYKQDPTSNPRLPATSPTLNPLQPPSIWAPYSLLPLFSLSASPLQIIAHNRSLRRTGISGSNVKAFLASQAAQTVAAVGIGIAFGVGVGTQGMGRHLGLELHPNLFTTLPLSDTLNLTRVLFIAILSSHLALCLVTVRSAWARLLHLFHLNPFRRKESGQPNRNESDTTEAPGASSVSTDRSQAIRKKKMWTRQARNALAGLLLWAITASTAYWSGVGGFHRRKGEKGNHAADEAVEANFTRAQEVLGLMGAGVGFVLPALMWIILFHIRRPRAILPPFAADLARQASAWFLGPQSVLAARKWRKSTPQDAEQQPLLDEEQDDEELPSSSTYRQSLDVGQHIGSSERNKVMPNERNASQASAVDDHDVTLERHSSLASSSLQHGSTTDDATRILLARKERELQRRSRGRRRYQDIIVLAGILPLGVALIILCALDLRHGGW